MNTGHRLAVLLLLCGVCAAQSSEQTFGLERGRILLPVFFNGLGPYPFLLDTLAEESVFDVAAAGRLGIAQAPQTGGQSPIARTGPLSPMVCGHAMPETAFLLADLSGFGRVLGRPVAGVLAGRHLEGALIFDFVAKRLSWRPADPIPIDPYTARFEESAEGPVLDIVLNGKPLRAVLDTSFGGVLSLPEPVAKTLDLPGESAKTLSLLPGGEAAANALQFRVETLRIATAELSGALCTVDASGDTARIGTGLLAHFRAAIGFPAAFLRLEPKGTLPVTGAPIEGCGLTPMSLQNGYWTVAVAEGSPADDGGASPGDLVLAVDEAPMLNVSWERLSALLNPPAGQEVRLTLRHAGETQVCVLVSQRLL